MRSFSKHLASFLLVALLVPSTVLAQEVNRKMYPDYNGTLNPDPSLMNYKKSIPSEDGKKRAATSRPSHVNNAELKFFPPVFNQDGGSCGSASRICYMFTHELNAYRNLDGSKNENNYPSHFVWLLTNGNSGKDEFVQNVGVPSSATYGGRTYSSLFGYQEERDNNFGWMTGYDKWFEAMHNRMYRPANFPMHVGTEEGREAVKHWLWNHSGDTSFHGGGICGIGVASAGLTYRPIANTTANSNAGVVGLQYLNTWGPQVDHALTIVGYDDRVEFDLNDNGIYGEKSADEVGAWIIVNSWGNTWASKGFIYCPYAYGGSYFRQDDSFSGDWWYPEIYKVRKDYRPLRTIKLKMEYSRRSEICLSAGVSSDLNATSPEKTVVFDHFKYAGDGNYGNTNPAPQVPMLGKWADGVHNEPMEFGYDLTDLSASFDRNMPLKYFFIIETKSWAAGSGYIHNASIMDYEHDTKGIETPFNLPGGKVQIQNRGNKTIISVVVYGESYYAPQNPTFTGSTLSWQAPVKSGHNVVGYNIYVDGVKQTTVSANTLSYQPSYNSSAKQTTFAVSALYDDDKVESAQVKTSTPIQPNGLYNTSVNLKNSGFSIPNVFTSSYNQATVEFWICPNSLSDWNQAAGPGWGSFMFHANANGTFTVGWDTSNRINTSASSLRTGTWTHVAFTVNGNVMTAYINGQNKGSITSSTYSGLGGFGNLNFRATGGDAWNAKVDEVRVWNYARSASQISSAKNLEFTGTVMPSGLVAYYRGDTFTDENGVNMLRDYIGGNHATLLNNNFAKNDATQPSVKPSTTSPSVSINSPSGNVYAGIPVKLTASCSESVSELLWTISDAGINNLSSAAPSVTFKSTGSKTVKVTAKTGSGASSTAERTIYVTEAPAADASFTMSQSTVKSGERVTFIPNAPQLGYTYEWSMPGAEVEKASTTQAATTYAKGGTYTVTLSVSTPSGNTRSTSQTIRVEAAAPKVDFAVSPSLILKGESFTLTDKSTGGPTDWTWKLVSSGNSFVAMGQNPTLTLDQPGVYNITLTAKNDAGMSSKTLNKALYVANADSKNGLNFGGSSASISANSPFTVSQTDFTIDWWMNPTQLGTYTHGMGDTDNTLLLKANNKGVLQLSIAGKKCYSQEGYIVTGEWHHYAVTFKSGVVQYYRDGQLITKGNPGITSLTYKPGKFQVGGSDTPFYGSIDELRVWNKVLSVSKLRTYANAPIANVNNAVSADGLVLYYDFNQSGGSVQDRTSKGYHATRSGFGPDGDAWGLSRGVFVLNFGETAAPETVTSTYLTNYRKAFEYNNTLVNPSPSNRFYELKGWKQEGNVKSGNITTGAHVDMQKSQCMTFTTTWDGFSTLADHKVYQTITLPAGYYTFTAHYDETYEGQCEDSYLVVAEGSTLPSTSALGQKALAFSKMAEKSSTTTKNEVSFMLSHESQVSLGLAVNMKGKSCFTIQQFDLVKSDFTVLEGNTTDDYVLTVPAAGYTTVSLPYDARLPEGLLAIMITDVRDNVAVATALLSDVLPARCPVIICGEAGKYTFEQTADQCPTSTGDNLLVSEHTSGHPVSTNIYYSLDPTSLGEPAFVPSGSSFASYRAYLPISRTSGIQSYYLIQFEDVSVDGVNWDTNSDADIYDISGRRVTQTQRGVYIKDGQKVVK